MLMYLTVLGVVVMTAGVATVVRSVVVRRLALGVAIASMILVAGLRNAKVGTDTSNYVQYFDHIRTLGDIGRVGGETQEYGFWVLTWLSHYLSDDYAGFFLLIATVVVLCYHRAICAYSRNIGISYYVFITYGVYIFFFNGARQGVACAIYALAIGPLLNRSFPKYVVLVLLASVFHKTALGMIPLYFVYNRSFSFKSIAMIMVLGVLTSVFLQKIITVASGFDPRYSQYGADIGTAGGYYYVAMDLAFVIFFTGIRKKILVHFEEYDRYLNMAYFGVMIDLVATLAGVDPSGILRLGFYSSIYMVLIWPIVFENLSEPLTRFVVGYLFVIGFILLFTLTLRQQSDLTPYIFNPSLHL